MEPRSILTSTIWGVSYKFHPEPLLRILYLCLFSQTKSREVSDDDDGALVSF